MRIFNDHRADELVFLDILATREGRLISLDFVRDVGEEANMPFAVGGGIRSLADIRSILSAGAEKVVINSFAAENPDFIAQAADSFGSSTITVCIDVKQKRFGAPADVDRGGNPRHGIRSGGVRQAGGGQGGGRDHRAVHLRATAPCRATTST